MTAELRSVRWLLVATMVVGVGGVAAAVADDGGDDEAATTDADSSTTSTARRSTSSTDATVWIDVASTLATMPSTTSTAAPAPAGTTPTSTPATTPTTAVATTQPPVTAPPVTAPPVTEPPVTVPPVPDGTTQVVVQNDMAVPLDVSVNGGFLRIGAGATFEGPALAEVDGSGVDLITVSHPQELGPPDAGCGSHQLAQLLEPGGRHLIRIQAAGTCQLLGGSAKPGFTVSRL